MQDTLTHICISEKERKNWRKIKSLDPSLFSTHDFKGKLSHTHKHAASRLVVLSTRYSRRYDERMNPGQAVLQLTQCANLRDRERGKALSEVRCNSIKYHSPLFFLHHLETFAIVSTILKVMMNVLNLHSILPCFELSVILR